MKPTVPSPNPEPATGARGSLRRSRARTGVAAALVLGALATCCATARATGYIRIVPAGATYARPVSLAQLPRAPQPDVVNRTYTDISVDGGPPRTVTVTGYSLPALLADLGVSPASFQYGEVVVPGGRSILLTYPQAASKGAYADGPPVVWQNGSGAHFLLPSLPGGSAFQGQSFTGRNETITVDLRTGALLSVGISSSTRTVAVGKPVQFTSAVAGAPAGSLDYTWSFGDGGSASQPSVSHSYTSAGTYSVYLSVSGSGGSLGVSSTIPIAVAHAPKGPNRAGGGTSTNATAPTGGAGTRGSGAGKGTNSKRTGAAPHHASKRALRKLPAGPLVSGIAVADVAQPAGRGGSGTAGGSQAARSGHLRPGGDRVPQGVWIGLGALALLICGALLEWLRPLRPAVRAR